MSAVAPLATVGAEILSNLLKIAASPQGLEIIARLLADARPDIHEAALGLKLAPEPAVAPPKGKAP